MKMPTEKKRQSKSTPISGELAIWSRMGCVCGFFLISLFQTKPTLAHFCRHQQMQNQPATIDLEYFQVLGYPNGYTFDLLYSVHTLIV